MGPSVDESLRKLDSDYVDLLASLAKQRRAA
jgi:hypothetical protein